MTTAQDASARVATMLEGGPALWLAAGQPPSPLPDAVGAVVQTSGSTGDGKRVVLSRAALLAGAQASRCALGADLTWHLVLPHRYVAGLMVLVRSLAADRRPVVSSTDLSDLQATGDGDGVSIVATQLHRALEDPVLTRRLTHFDAVLVGGAALSPELRRRARDAGINVTETYGMSETCGGVVWDGAALPGTFVAVVDDERAPRGTGRIALGGPTLCDGYLDDSGALAPAAHDGLLVTADWGSMRDGRLTVGGRLDDVVITGGVNVDLAVVRRAVEAVDPEAAVLGVDDPEWGTRIVLFASEGTLSGWRDLLAPTLGRTALPRQFVRVAEMPRTPGGKPERRALLALAAR
ncbi:AMP-binding protein [Tessaracoccus antarcticus]|uniref:AMP-dependent synthetase n=1 Tax=Tessaracoccus antarcticus TaxID=2479848 RepID=A0A3M0GLP1_9ACTN|nr:AMP-binding protein [Tessaracoccus antarcticus]RMB58216.1 AMP-dependent synthetase [Tessaracoccus antarcticus]